jgi:hypothetical protein
VGLINQAPTSKPSLINQAPTRIYHNKTRGVNGKGQYKGDAPPLFHIVSLSPLVYFFIKIQALIHQLTTSNNQPEKISEHNNLF